MTEPANASLQSSPPRQSSLIGYTRMIRRHKLLMGVVVLIFVAGSLVHSLHQPTRYTAQAVVLFQDPNQDLSLTGSVGAVILTPEQRAQIGADTFVSPSLLTTVKQLLKTSLSTGALKSALSTSADPASSQVTIQAQASTQQFAADLANTTAEVGTVSETAAQRRRYATAASRLAAVSHQLGRSSAAANQRISYADQIARLRSLSTFAQPVEVASRASLPTSPSSPKPVSSVILFGILGLIFALVAVAVRESFDRRLRSISDIEEGLGLPVLGHVRQDAMGKAGASSKGLGTLSQADTESFRILRTNLRFAGAKRSVKSILVTSPMPQEGKSTVAASLAFSYAAAGRSTLLVECDFRRPSLAERLGVNPRPGLINFLLGECAPADIVQIVPDATAEVGANGNSPTSVRAKVPLAAIVAGEHPEGQSAELFESPAFLEFVAQVSEAYDIVLIDTAPLLPVADTLELVANVDAVLMCVRATQTTRDQASAGKAALDPVGEHLAGIVITGVSEHDQGSYGYYGYYGYQERPERSATTAA